ncbi:FtsW/RodA/SpoVE family cell cycle protein, partial [Galactobacillus timonensis]
VGIAGIIYLLTPAGIQLVEMLPIADYQKNRFISAFNPFADQYDTGYQLINGLISFASGGWRGLGFGNSVRKYTSFPAANTDFILAIVVEEMGMIGFLLIFIPYLIILCRLFHYALHMKSEKGRIILIGTAMYLLIHCLFNIGGVTAMIPLTGVPLLMISSGGSSTLAFMVSIGLAQAVISQYRKGLIQ